jgi:hypothetical protein
MWYGVVCKTVMSSCNIVYYETIERWVNRRLTYECRWDERLKAKAEGSTRLAYTGWRGGLEHLKIESRLINESFASVMGEYVILTPQVRRRYSIQSVVLQP